MTTFGSSSPWRLAAVLVAIVPGLGAGARSEVAPVTAECVVIGVLGSPPVISDAAECARPTAPASTFKIPHALIALQTGVVTPTTEFEWDGTDYQSTLWRRTHTLDSAIKWSALPFFQRTARLIGKERMRVGLAALGYAADGFDGDIATFWLNGDLVVTPLEQYGFLQRFFGGGLAVEAAHLAAVRQALLMPPGQVTNASGAHPFELAWPGQVTVRAKTGNTSVKEERVSWLVGEVESRGVEYVVVARVRSSSALEGTAGLEAARRGLDAFARRRVRQ